MKILLFIISVSIITVAGYLTLSSRKSCGGFMASTGSFGCPPLFYCKTPTECCDLPGKCVFNPFVK